MPLGLLAMFESGTLWELVVRRRAEAAACGAMYTLPTNIMRVTDAGVQFLVRVLAHLEAKARLRDKEESDRRAHNPFLPYEQALFVSDVGPHHVCLFNKFNVVEHHLLLVTRNFEHQDLLLTVDDFAALASCMCEFDALGFYNGGVLAGASQTHKHLQIVPLPLAAGVERLIIEPVALDAFRFVNVLESLGSSAFDKSDHGNLLYTTYRRLLERAGVGVVGGRQGMAYNLLVTRDWMLVVPRRAECCGSISVNALSFAGSIFVRNETELQMLRELGPLRVLEAVTLPAPP